MKNSILLLAMIGLISQNLVAKVTYPYKDKTLPVEVRVKDLVNRMTTEEKFWQVYMMPGDVSLLKSDKFKHGVFGFQVHTLAATDPDMKQMLQYDPSLNATQTAKTANDIQRYFVEKTRLGIPVILFHEALHGLVSGGATAFPQSIGLAATFDTTLVHRVSYAIAQEVRSRGIRQILSPVINLATDVRWGRVEETYGEDPYLSSVMGVSFVSSFENMGVITTPKHYLANVGAGGRDSYPIHLSKRYLEETHLAPFKACIQQGGTQSLMTSYNTLDGIPCSANSWLLIDKLRTDWGFDGFTISDADAVGIINKLHHTSASYGDASSDAINNGLDVIFQTAYEEHLPILEACLDGRVKKEALDRAVTQVLKAKFRLGLFDDPYIDVSQAGRFANSQAHRDLAYEAAQKSIVLLKNSQDILPLVGHAKQIAVLGEDAVEARLGGYSGPGCDKVSILAGLQSKFNGKNTKIAYALGCKRMTKQSVVVAKDYLTTAAGTPGLDAAYYDNISFEGTPTVRRIDKNINFRWTLFAPDPALPVDWFSAEWNGFVEAPESGNFQIGLEGNDGYTLWVNGKKLVDRPTKASYTEHLAPYSFEKGKKYAIRVRFYENTRNAHVKLKWTLGVQNEDAEMDAAVQLAQRSDVAIVVAGIEEGEFRDRAFLTLPGRQEELIQRVAATGTPVVVVLVGGSAVVMNNWKDQANAILAAWYPGDRGGDAVADVLVGDYNPSGKLPITYPVDESQLPLSYLHTSTGRGDDYLNLSGEPLFPFGYGLSYSQFKYNDMQVTYDAATATHQVSFSILNMSSRDANEVPQFYIRDLVASVAQPVIKLIHFKSVFVPAGQQVDVVFNVTDQDLSMLNQEMHRVVEAGDFRLMIGRSSKDIRLKKTLSIAQGKCLD